MGVEIVFICGGCDGLQCFFIQILCGIYFMIEQEIFDYYFICIDVDGINCGVVLFGDIGGFKWVKYFCGIVVIIE